MIKIFIMLIFITFCGPQFLLAAITFDENGKWETTFDCGEQVQGSYNCDGMSDSPGWNSDMITGVKIANGGSGYSVYDNISFYNWSQGRAIDLRVLSVDRLGGITSVEITHPGFSSGTNSVGNTYNITGGGGSGAIMEITSVESKAGSITADANHTGGYGFRHWVGDGSNSNSGGINIRFPSPQPEVWFRYYIRYPAGFKWTNGYPSFDKQIYVWNARSGHVVIAGYRYGNAGLFSSPSPAVFAYNSPYHQFDRTWEYSFPTGSADGSWHAFEFYMKMDTVIDGVSRNDGIAATWHNGNLVAYRDDFSFSKGDSTATQGWERFLVGSNQSSPNNKAIVPVDYDDIVIYTSTPPNVDVFGNPMIGPIGWDNGGLSRTVAPPPSLQIIYPSRELIR